MRVRVAGESRAGRSIDLRTFGVAPATVADAVRGDTTDDCPVVVDCPEPGPVHERVGVIAPETHVSRRVALADAARSRGYTAPQSDELAEIRDRLGDLDPPAVDLQRARKRVADAGDVEAELRERVATLQGRVRALRENDDGAVEAAETDLADATRRLSEVQTERIAAEQALARTRERARAARATRRERLRLEDRAGNLRRAARDHLADRVTDAFETARDSIPDGADLDESVETALAVARVADLDAPVVLACDVAFLGSPSVAARWLDADVVRV